MTHPQCFTIMGATRNTDNYGVRVLLSSASDAITRAFPRARLYALDYGPRPELWRERSPRGPRAIPLVNLRFSWRIHLPNNVFRLLMLVLLTRLLPASVRHRIWDNNPWLRRARSADAHFSIAGGDSFSDIYGLRRFLYVTLPQLLVLFMGRPLVQLPQTYGPFRSSLARAVARFILRRSAYVFSRDEQGVRTIKGLLGEAAPGVHVVPDLGLAMEPSPTPLDPDFSSASAGALPLVGFNVSSLLYMGGYDRANMFGLRDAFPALVDTILHELTRDSRVNVVLVPHVCGDAESVEDETRLCRRIADEYRQKHGRTLLCLDGALDHRQIKHAIGRCDMFLGARMHACIAAVSQAVPSVCLAYSGKFEGVMAPLGEGAVVVDLRSAPAETILATVRSVFSQRAPLRDSLTARLKTLPDFSGILAARIPRLNANAAS